MPGRELVSEDAIWSGTYPYHFKVGAEAIQLTVRF